MRALKEVGVSLGQQARRIWAESMEGKDLFSFLQIEFAVVYGKVGSGRNLVPEQE